MKTKISLPIILTIVLFIISTVSGQPTDKFRVYLSPVQITDTSYLDEVNYMVWDIFKSNGIIDLSKTKKMFLQNKVGNSPNSELVLHVNVNNVKMERILAPVYNHSTKETTYKQCYNLIVEMKIEFTELNSNLVVVSKSFAISHNDRYEPGLISESETRAVKKTMNLLMGSICSWMNSEFTSKEKILAKIEIKKAAVQHMMAVNLENDKK